MATIKTSLSNLYNPITNPSGSLAGGKFSLGSVAAPGATPTYTPAPSLPTPALNGNTQSGLSQLSLPSSFSPSISPNNANLAGIGSKVAINPQGQPTIGKVPAALAGGVYGANTPAPTGATGPTLSSVYSGGGSGPIPPAPSGGATGSSGATGPSASTMSLPPQYYNADGTLKTPQQVASEVGNSLAAAQGGTDINKITASQFSNQDGKTTIDAQNDAQNINNTKNDISTGATDPYGVASQSGIAYTPEELDAIQKAYAGVYTPALNSALSKVTLKQSEDKAALDQQNQLAQIDEQAKATVAAQGNAPYTLGADEIRYDASGNPIAAGPESYQRALLSGNGGAATALNDYTRQTASGNKYVDLSTVTDPTQKAALENAAKSQGLMPVTDANASKLQAIDDTRTNLQSIQSQFDSISGNGLETAAGGFGLFNAAKGAFGNADVGSFQAWRTAAINSIQALAGGSGSGLRINQAEINSAMTNDIPNIGDSTAVGDAKIKVLNTQLNNWENQILNTTGSTGTAPTGATGSNGFTPTGNGSFTALDGATLTPNGDGTYTRSFSSVGNTTASTLPLAPVGTDSSLTLNRPQRNNNPGDIKPGGIADRYANGKTAQGDLTFASPAVGFNALKADVTAKINGGSSHLPANPTIAQLGSVYAEDPNWGAKVAGILGVPSSTSTKSIPIQQLIHAIATQEGFFANNTVA